ncbi:B12-binding domain-containing radical SAM protein [Oscillospiraceae bacterium CM]|nr:B12-binding domain-containing radical SAM protein [Oscillospiraceae bacterium CM]
MKIRLIEPGNLPYRKSFKNLYLYDKYIRTPSNGLLTLTTIVKQYVSDTLMYSESISEIIWKDVLDADIIFISIFTFNAVRGYELADEIRKKSRALIVFGGLHATLNYSEACRHGDYVLLGEGDASIIQFIQAVQANKPIDFPGVAYYRDEQLIHTGSPKIPEQIETIPNRFLLYNFKKMAGHNTIWPQVHASRGCPHQCDYCALVAAFGRKLRHRAPETIIEDIRQAIRFFENGYHRLTKILWLTDDNFFADRGWAIRVLNALIDSKISYNFTIQARYEVGLDDEMLELLKRAGFVELAVGIEFIEDEAFEIYHKKSTRDDIRRSIKNIQAHGLRVRGLFIVGAENHTKGIGRRLADFVIENKLCGVLIQSMYFIPGTPVYETYQARLLDLDWSRCVGKVVHYPKNISPYDLQKEIILASRRIYSIKRLFEAITTMRGNERLLFIGEYFWQKNVRKNLLRDLPYLKKISENALPGACPAGVGGG